MNKIDNRKYRMTKIMFGKREEIVEALLDTGSSITVLSKNVADKLKLSFNENFNERYELEHSDGKREHTFITFINILIRGYKFKTFIVVSDKIKSNMLIIGADFMKQYSMFLKFNVSDNEITLIPQNKHRIKWEV